MENNDKIADRVANDVAGYIQNKRNFLLVTSADEEIRSLDAKRLERYLKLVQPYYGGNEMLFVTDRNGKQVWRTDKLDLQNVAERRYFQEVMTGHVVMSEPVLSKGAGQLGVVGAVPIQGESREPIGVLGVVLPLQNLQVLLERVLSENPGYGIVVLNQQKVPLFHPGNAEAVKERRPLEEAFYTQVLEQKNRESGNTGTRPGLFFILPSGCQHGLGCGFSLPQGYGVGAKSGDGAAYGLGHRYIGCLLFGRRILGGAANSAAAANTDARGERSRARQTVCACSLCLKE